MTQEEKKLLLQDLSGRLMYGVKIQRPDLFCPSEMITEELIAIDRDCINDNGIPIEYVKPYLRPLSSMTENENDDLYESGGRACWNDDSEIILNDYAGFKEAYRSLIWLVRNHFDCFNLLGQGLAIKVTKNNNPYKRNDIKKR